ncbi:unnamed protein product [Rhizoctonia solani]|uniref:BTB domain-containing protein n=1 Tax=Rhizoctonia solani TaxID=456999 RepID=A0A8H3ANT0_9AGAM|nr:unnamed protein product [Rhizoctonia solani]
MVTSKSRFWVHEFLLSKFTKFTELIRQARDRREFTADPERRTIILIPSDGKVQCEDLRNTFQVIYSSTDSVFGQTSPSSDEETLVSKLISALRVATVFGNPGLRKFAVSQLESKQSYTTAISRIALSDELKLPSWELSAFTELCRRPEPISVEEANILGITRFVEIARIRESEQHRRYTDLISGVTINPFLNRNGTLKKDKLQTMADKTLEYTTLPQCDCRVRNQCSCYSDELTGPRATRGLFMHFDKLQQAQASTSPVITCKIHRIAPSILSESRVLYGHLSSFVEKIAVLKNISTQMRGPLGNDEGYSIGSELRRADWVRKEE